MAKCQYCNKEMLKANGCDCILFEYKDGTKLKPLKYGEDFGIEYPELPDRCHDCNCKKGEYHHPGCDMERCPRCKRQAISCDCERK